MSSPALSSLPAPLADVDSAAFHALLTAPDTRFPALRSMVARSSAVSQMEVDERCKWWKGKGMRVQEWMAPFFIAREKVLAEQQSEAMKRQYREQGSIMPRSLKLKLPRVCTRINTMTTVLPDTVGHGGDCAVVCECVICGSKEHGARQKTPYQPGASADEGGKYLCAFRTDYAREIAQLAAMHGWTENDAMLQVDRIIEWKRERIAEERGQGSATGRSWRMNGGGDSRSDNGSFRTGGAGGAQAASPYFSSGNYASKGPSAYSPSMSWQQQQQQQQQDRPANRFSYGGEASPVAASPSAMPMMSNVPLQPQRRTFPPYGNEAPMTPTSNPPMFPAVPAAHSAYMASPGAPPAAAHQAGAEAAVPPVALPASAVAAASPHPASTAAAASPSPSSAAAAPVPVGPTVPTTVRLRVHLPSEPDVGVSVCADSFAELLSELDLPADTKLAYSLQPPTEAEPQPTPITEQQMWGLAKHTHLYAYEPQVRMCEVPWAKQCIINPKLTRSDRCALCNQPLDSPAHDTAAA